MSDGGWLLHVGLGAKYSIIEILNVKFIATTVGVYYKYG